MSTLDSDTAAYTLEREAQGSKSFFNKNPASDWSFQQYLDCTFILLNKSIAKNFQFVVRQYKDDLEWLLKQNIPRDIKKLLSDYVISGSSNKKRKGVNKPILVTNNYGNIGNNNTIQSQTIYTNSNGESSRAASKRKVEEQEEEENSQLDDGELLEIGGSNNIWREWTVFLSEEHKNTVFHPNSLEANKIIRCGGGISPRPHLDRELYEKHLNTHKDAEFSLPAACTDYIDSVIDSLNLNSYKKNLRKSPDFEDDEEQEAAAEFIMNIFFGSLRAHESHQDICASEEAFKQLFVEPFLVPLATSLEAQGDYINGEAYLKAMTTQLKNNGAYIDDRYQYKADGIIRLYGVREMEILLLEVSHEFGNKNDVKHRFDHHKGVYGAPAMSKTIADEFPYASLDIFKNIKVSFTQAAGKEIHLWSLRFVPGENEGDGLYDLYREVSYVIKPSFVDKGDMLLNLLIFWWNAKKMLDEAVFSIIALRNSHDEIKKEYRYSTAPTLLTELVNPVILKLSEKDHSAGMGNLGPIFSPEHD